MKMDRDGKTLTGGERVILRGLVWIVSHDQRNAAGVRIYKQDKKTGWQMRRKVVRPADIRRIV